MESRIVESWLLLVYVDCLMRCRGLGSIEATVRKQRVIPWAEKDDASSLCGAVDMACVFYFKPVLCLQRSAATTILLRRYGWKAEMVIGAQMLPFQAHAWVEVDGSVVNDRPYIRDIFQELARC